MVEPIGRARVIAVDKLCGWLKGENIQPPGGTGGSMSVIGALGGWVRSPGLVGTFDWTKGCIMFTTDHIRHEPTWAAASVITSNASAAGCGAMT